MQRPRFLAIFEGKQAPERDVKKNSTPKKSAASGENYLLIIL